MKKRNSSRGNISHVYIFFTLPHLSSFSQGTIVIRSCRALARHILGEKEEAYVDAVQAIKSSQALKTKTCNLGVPMTLSYSIKVSTHPFFSKRLKRL